MAIKLDWQIVKNNQIKKGCGAKASTLKFTASQADWWIWKKVWWIWQDTDYSLWHWTVKAKRWEQSVEIEGVNQSRTKNPQGIIQLVWEDINYLREL